MIRHLAALSLLRLLLLTCSLLSAGNSFAHSGPLDKQGGHFRHDRQSYHCHREPCHNLHRQAEKAVQEAQQKQRPFSNTYRREDWPHWSDKDADCQNTRAEILIATSRKPVQFHRQHAQCSVRKGEWYDPYTDRTFSNASQLDIDHIIALAEAHRYGGANWSDALKEQFANDPLNLIAVQREANRAKGSLPAYQWMPKNLAYWCDYIRSREAVAKKYRLQLPDREQQFQQKIRLQHCPAQAGKTAD